MASLPRRSEDPVAGPAGRPEPVDEPGLREYIDVLRHRRWIVISCVVVAVGMALIVSLLQDPRYRAKSELLLGRTTDEAIMADQFGQARTSANAERELNNEIRLIESSAVREAVRDAYEGPLDVRDVHASAGASDSDDSIDVTLESTDPVAAADLVNLYVETYVEVRQQRTLDELLDASDEIQARLDELREQINEVSQPLDDITARVAAAPVDSSERARLEDERQAVTAQVLPQLAPLQSREGAFRGQLDQLQVSQDLMMTGGIEILDEADASSKPVSPNTFANVAVAAILGLLAGVSLALVADRLDDSVRSKDTAQHLTGVPVLGVIPELSPASGGDLASLADPSSHAAESYRLLRTSVRFLGIETPMNTLLVTSAVANEGKTVTAANIAVALAHGGERVLLIGADLRRPRVHLMFGAPESPGLTSVLLGEVTPESAIYGVAEVPGLHVMAPGPTPPNPAEVLDSPRARELLTSLAALYDRVIVDSPPVLPVTDAQVLSRVADAVLLVVAHGKTSKRGLTRASELLGQVDAPVIGTVVTRAAATDSYSGQGYRYTTYKGRRADRRTPKGQAPSPAASGNGHTGNGGTPVRSSESVRPGRSDAP